MGVQHPKLVNLFLKACFWPLKILFLRTVTPTKEGKEFYCLSSGGTVASSRLPPLHAFFSLRPLTNFWDVPRKKRLWFFFRFRCRNQALIWNWSSFFLSRTYSLILSTQQEVDKRKLVKLTQLDCERNQRLDFGNGKETRCSTCTYFKSWTSHCTLGWAILTHSSCESSKKCHHQIHFSQPCSLSDKLLFSPAFP